MKRSVTRRRAWRLGLPALVVMGGLCVLECGSSTTPKTTPPEVEVKSPHPEDDGFEQACPSSWDDPVTGTVSFTEDPKPPAPVGAAPFSIMVQGTDSDRGVQSEAYAAMISTQFPSGQLVMLGKHEDTLPGTPYLSHLSSLSESVDLSLTLDATDTVHYGTVADIISGLTVFDTMVTSAGRSLTTLVYQKDGGPLKDEAEIVALSVALATWNETNGKNGMNGGDVELAVLGGINASNPTAPKGWSGTYTSIVEAYGMFSHDCPSEKKDPEVQILVDGPAGGASICADRCLCTPSGTESIYELCTGEDGPAQAGRIAGYLASLKAAPKTVAGTDPVQKTLNGVIYLFSFEPDPGDNPTLFPTDWDPDDYKDFADAFAKMVAFRAKANAGTITMGPWDMTNEYWTDNGWE
jgi:hypothetical protein